MGGNMFIQAPRPRSASSSREYWIVHSDSFRHGILFSSNCSYGYMTWRTVDLRPIVEPKSRLNTYNNQYHLPRRLGAKPPAPLEPG